MPQAVTLTPLACDYWRGTWQCRGDGFLWDADHDGFDPDEQDSPCPCCNAREYLMRAKEEAETCSAWADISGAGTGEDIWLWAVKRTMALNPVATAAALATLGPVRALVPADNQDGFSERLHNASSASLA